MNPTLFRALMIAAPVGALLVSAIVVLKRSHTFSAVCWLLGMWCFVIVVLTHVAEAMQWFPGMRWGYPDSAGHYLDLGSAITGVALVMVGTIARCRRVRR